MGIFGEERKTLGKNYENDTKDFIEELKEISGKDKLPEQDTVDEAVKKFKENKSLFTEGLKTAVLYGFVESAVETCGVEVDDVKNTYNNLEKIAVDYESKGISLEMAETKMVAESAGVDTTLFPEASVDNFKDLARLEMAGIDTRQFKDLGKNGLDVLKAVTDRDHDATDLKAEFALAELKDMSDKEGSVEIEFDNGDIFEVENAGNDLYKYYYNGKQVDILVAREKLSQENFENDNIEMAKSENIDEILKKYKPDLSKQINYDLSEATTDILLDFASDVLGVSREK